MTAVIGGLFAAKYLASAGAGRLFHMSRDDRLLMWSLSVPQVAATLAAALVASQARNAAGQPLLDQAIVNTVVVLVLATAVAGPVVTRRVALRLSQ